MATVTFNANGGTGTMSPQTASVATPLTANSFTFTGHTFLQWNDSPDGTGANTYADGASYPFASSITFYAIWKVGISSAPITLGIGISATTTWQYIVSSAPITLGVGISSTVTWQTVLNAWTIDLYGAATVSVDIAAHPTRLYPITPPPGGLINPITGEFLISPTTGWI